MAKSARNLLWKMEMPFQSMGWLMQTAEMERSRWPSSAGPPHPAVVDLQLQCCSSTTLSQLWKHLFPPSISATFV